MVKIGIDIGSTTAKIAVIGTKDEILFTHYVRHQAKTRQVTSSMLRGLMSQIGDIEAQIRITGSVGMGLAEQADIPFVQEVVAATRAIQKDYPQVRSMIDIGGEDAKVVFFEHAEAKDLRMNGNCAGGTGAFIDQMAVLLGVDVKDMNGLAQQATRTYPIASRCGVFCKTDIQNLMAKNANPADIAASIFHAVAVQTVVTLAHGCDIHPPVLFCGGPLTFIPVLRKAFANYLHLKDEDMLMPENGTLMSALGTALSVEATDDARPLSEWIRLLETTSVHRTETGNGLRPLFSTETEYEVWKARMGKHTIPATTFKPGKQDVFIGIDSGSTTTKIVVTDEEKKLLFTYYATNGGNPIQAVTKGLTKLKEACGVAGTELNIKGSCSTGYGEDLIKAAFQLDQGIVETIAHYIAASHIDKDVSFILDIGGQDMKAMFVDKGIISRIEINEACSSGCGSFIETFARTLGYEVQDFARLACLSPAPCDLGSRCTVFMNSKVKQVLCEGVSVKDIAAGLAYSVVKNCLYKVLKLNDAAQLGKHIVVQGGTMRNDAVVRALELLTGAEVSRCDVPELMGAYGCALYAGKYAHVGISLDNLLENRKYTQENLHCKGCENRCLVSRYRFASGKTYYSGNRCERVFTNGEENKRGTNAYVQKNKLLFARADTKVALPLLHIGIPRCLNMYENFPFWHTLFTACGIQVTLSDASNFARYEQSARMVMSDNICFPAKLVHSHIQNLIEKQVDRIFMPFVIFERKGAGEQNSYNCPIATGYSEVIRSVQGDNIPIDSPAISFKDKDLLYRQCRNYLRGLGVQEMTIVSAFRRAESEQNRFVHQLTECNRTILNEALTDRRFTIFLAGRPYHTDSLVQHKVSDMIAGMGIHVITDDVARGMEIDCAHGVHFLAQWSYPNRILKAAEWCTEQGEDVQFVQLTSFGCGPDAFLTDEIRDLLARHGKAYTLLKLDDINNIGSMKLRVRSLVESLKLRHEQSIRKFKAADSLGECISIRTEELRQKKILVPFFTPFISPLIPAVMQVAGYDVETLPPSDKESCDWGLKYANNEVCYPATLIVGDVIKAFKSGKYDPEKTVVAMTQTGGQCRASNYVALIRKALLNAGHAGIPVVPFTFTGDGLRSGFQVNWIKVLPVAIRTLLYSDCIAKFYHASAPRERTSGQAAALKDLYLRTAADLIRRGKSKDLYAYLGMAARQFNDICKDKDCPKVGVVGEIFLKFNPFAHKHLTDWLTERGIEVVPSALTDFFMQAFVNQEVRSKTDIQHKSPSDVLYKLAYRAIQKQITEVNRIASGFHYFTPLNDIFAEAEEARNIISLNAQFGEGWLLPAEIISCVRQGVNHVVSLQPFGCIANHIVSKGIEKRLRSLFPDLNLLSLDFDSGVSDVNIFNRLLLFIDTLFTQPKKVGKEDIINVGLDSNEYGRLNCMRHKSPISMKQQSSSHIE